MELPRSLNVLTLWLMKPGILVHSNSDWLYSYCKVNSSVCCFTPFLSLTGLTTLSKHLIVRLVVRLSPGLELAGYISRIGRALTSPI